ncbi:ABC transporter substrate-binding protein [Planomonospora venezuelensis]|uniref:Alpha-glucoside transport system substrate-binding protein n=1 Tax=Planomonospora venezuelensis TaxID=1999 RepID=A0A841D5J6_PLAVE|nr:ABC transporter substrate-binding protein [Planomonospora venezuelensis]MBB5964223.1 alpha-glucoside transport system substrate-binding protein [Planomonospora venezuelensis]GIN04367.1 alpha-glucoside ABC transporter substrate-binding protein [Planomonospora venezuelensis]
MNKQSHRGRKAAAGAVAALSSLLLAACGTADAAGTAKEAAAREAACAPYAAYRGHEGTTVTLLMNDGFESVKATQALRRFSDCTSIRVDVEGAAGVEDEVKKRVGAGDPPDLAIVAQPGLIATLAGSGNLKPAAGSVAKAAGENWSADWLTYGSVDGELYAIPFDSNVSSYVWYSPAALKKEGYEVPRSWDELMAVSAKIADTGRTPWCLGLGSGAATGWPATNWIEDAMLAMYGPDVYDQWVTHAIPFDDPKVLRAAERAERVVKNEKYVRGGVRNAATTYFEDAGLPILRGECSFYRLGSFYAGSFPRGTKVAADGDVFAFPVPPADPSEGRLAIVGSTFTGAFSDRPEVAAVHTYLATGDFASRRVSLGGWMSANNKVDMSLYKSDLDKLSAEIMRDPDTTVRFDGSDMMPAAVGTGSFWTGMTDWIKGEDTETVLAEIEKSWP